eukprot:TRINITY_DN1183_c0_g1_i1.p1 TRINITY_DN1183_c0_g1~~TRINITY_DN1183_c0_g1_i1.p1  ORF type:complete len:350 (+),score=59.89 TRINITY_DN1183_c0_g1_i1:84-1133(+)
MSAAACSLLSKAGAVDTVPAVGAGSVQKGGGAGMAVFVDGQCIEVEPDTTVGQLRALAGVGRNRLMSGAVELDDDAAMLADLGICAEARIEVLLGSQLPRWNTDLPHPSIHISDDGYVAQYNGSGGTATVLSVEPIAAGVPVRVIFDKVPGNSYFGVGFSPMPNDVRSLINCRVASDGGGPGWSFNKNGECYGPFLSNPMSGMREGSDPSISQGDTVTWDLDPKSGLLVLTHDGARFDAPRVKEGSIEGTEQPIYAAVFFCNGTGASCRFVSPDGDPRQIERMELPDPPRQAKQSRDDSDSSDGSDGAVNEADLAHLVQMGFDAEASRAALRRHGGNLQRACSYLVGDG